MSSKELESSTWLPAYKSVHQCINAITFTFINNGRPYYLNEVYECIPQCRIESRSNFAKFNIPLWKTNTRQKELSYISLSLSNNLPGSRKKATILNTFKHILKKQYFDSLFGSQN